MVVLDIMSASLIQYLPLLKLLVRSSPSGRKALLQQADGKFIVLLVECCHNANKGNIAFKPRIKEKLHKHASVIRKVASGKLAHRSLQKKRKLLVQYGGFLPALLAPVLAIARSLIGELI